MKKLSLLLIFVLLTGCSAPSLYDENGQALGTFITVKSDIKNPVIGRAKEIERLMSVNIDTSEISAINSASGSGAEIDVSKEVHDVITEALKISRLTDGDFDITVGKLVKDWGISTDAPHVPAQEVVDVDIALIDYKDIEVKEKSVFLSKTGQMIDLGGIAKGYACDEMKRLLIENGSKCGLVNAGGNIAAYGLNGDNRWRIGIQDPQEPTGEYLGVLTLTDAAISTSGDYQRFFVSDGKRYHHIFDPKTGQPADNQLTSVTVIADSAVIADAFSTAAFVKGLEQGKKLLLDNQLTGIFITKEKKIYISPDLKEQFKLTNPEYVFM